MAYSRCARTDEHEKADLEVDIVFQARAQPVCCQAPRIP